MEYQKQEPDSSLYERFDKKPDFPINYSFDWETQGSHHLTPAHWHEHMELLLATQGVLRVYIQGGWVEAAPGELVVVNAGEIHGIPEKAADTLYMCLIPHKSLCSRMGLPVEDLTVAHHVCDREIAPMFHGIFEELAEKPSFYKTDVQAQAVRLLVYLARNCSCQNAQNRRSAPSSRERMVKQAMAYIQERFREPLSTEDVCNYLGFEKSYVCNSFKAITGTTILEHLNMIRCENARELLQKGEMTVSQCAAQSGFRHMSYFTKTYRRYIGQLPSQTVKAAAP